MSDLSPAEMKQRQDAARARWAKAGIAVAGAASAGYSLPRAVLNERRPSPAEVKVAFRQDGKGAMAALRAEGADKAMRSRLWVGGRRNVMAAIEGSLRPIGNRRVQAASGTALALMAAGIALPGIRRSRDLVDGENRAAEARVAEKHEQRMHAALQWGAGVTGALGSLRAAIPAVRRVLRAALLAAGAAALGVAHQTKKDS